MIKIEGADKSFESCQDCVHAYDSTEICILRRCIHAFSELRECYKPKKELKPSAQPEPSMEECACCVLSKPERKKGKWIKITTGAMREKYMCSICGRTIEEDGIERLVRIRYPFCHCGAEMEGQDDSI